MSGELKGTSRERFRAFRQTPEYAALRLQYDLAELIQGGLAKGTGMTQRELARKVGKSESYISRLLHSEARMFRVLSQVLHALGVRPKLVDGDQWDTLVKDHAAPRTTQGSTHGQATIIRSATSAGCAVPCIAVGHSITDTFVGRTSQSLQSIGPVNLD